MPLSYTYQVSVSPAPWAWSVEGLRCVDRPGKRQGRALVAKSWMANGGGEARRGQSVSRRGQCSALLEGVERGAAARWAKRQSSEQGEHRRLRRIPRGGASVAGSSESAGDSTPHPEDRAPASRVRWFRTLDPLTEDRTTACWPRRPQPRSVTAPCCRSLPCPSGCIACRPCNGTASLRPNGPGRRCPLCRCKSHSYPYQKQKNMVVVRRHDAMI